MGGQGGPNSQQAHEVASTSFRRRVPIRFLINQCQIITFLILKYDIIENSRVELRGIVLPVQMGGLLGGGAKGYVAPPPLSNYWGAWPHLPPPPSSYAYVALKCVRVRVRLRLRLRVCMCVCGYRRMDG